jgi:hypothetical protein
MIEKIAAFMSRPGVSFVVAICLITLGAAALMVENWFAAAILFALSITL